MKIISTQRNLIICFIFFYFCHMEKCDGLNDDETIDSNIKLLIKIHFHIFIYNYYKL